MVKCLAQGHKDHDSNPHSAAENTRAWARWTRPLSHDFLQKKGGMVSVSPWCWDKTLLITINLCLAIDLCVAKGLLVAACARGLNKNCWPNLQRKSNVGTCHICFCFSLLFRIKGWWVIHHYLSVVLCGILLIWPSGVSYDMFRNRFMAFSLYLSKFGSYFIKVYGEC